MDGLEMKGRALATLLGQNLGAAIDFDDKAAAEETLLPLKEDSEFAYVLVVKQDKETFSTLGKVPPIIEKTIRAKLKSDTLQHDEIITIFEPVMSQKNKEGVLAIGFSMKEIVSRSR